MALDDQEKRMSASGAGRPYMRGKLPGANDQQWRIASGNAYAGNALSPDGANAMPMAIHHLKMAGGL